MLGQFILNLFIAALWLLLKDEPTAQFTTFVNRIFSWDYDFICNASISSVHSFTYAV